MATGKFPFSTLGKTGILWHPEGFVKIVRETKYDELLGVHILGAHATDLIAEAEFSFLLDLLTLTGATATDSRRAALPCSSTSVP